MPMSKKSPELYWSKPVGMLPNSRFPLLVHRSGIPAGDEQVLKRFQSNGWLNNWRYPGIYTYPHFHSTTHECLGCASGWMDVELFGRSGTRIRVEAGDVIVMPAGVSHQMVGHSEDILMIGGYPEGRDWDNMQEEHISEEVRRAAVKRIMMLGIPGKDPVTGEAMVEWITAPSSVDANLNEFRDALDPV
jgi:uncharacterized protein YjlB